MNKIAGTPRPPYYAVIFTSLRTGEDDGYSRMADEMMDLVSKQPGFLGAESARHKDFGITVSYWESLSAIKAWKENPSHQAAQKIGKEKWYSGYAIRVCKVERDKIKGEWTFPP
jgi:heme-degrading monooxygenase HmoA